MWHLMPMKSVALDWHRSGGSCRKAIFCPEVSAVLVCCVSVTFDDLMSSDPLSHLYDTSIDAALNDDDGNSFGVV
jgi:hypothetical protein